MFLKGSEVCTRLLNQINEVKEKYEYNCKEGSKLGLLKADLMNEIRESDTPEGGYNSYLELRETLKKITELKEENKSLESVHSLFFNSDEIINNITDIKKNCENKEEESKNKKYTPHINKSERKMPHSKVSIPDKSDNTRYFDIEDPKMVIYTNGKDLKDLTSKLKLNYESVVRIKHSNHIVASGYKFSKKNKK